MLHHSVIDFGLSRHEHGLQASLQILYLKTVGSPHLKGASHSARVQFLRGGL